MFKHGVSENQAIRSTEHDTTLKNKTHEVLFCVANLALRNFEGANAVEVQVEHVLESTRRKESEGTVLQPPEVQTGSVLY